jgi:hypothetical protein
MFLEPEVENINNTKLVVMTAFSPAVSHSSWQNTLLNRDATKTCLLRGLAVTEAASLASSIGGVALEI